ncbi:uncharacterized protein BJ171DRAFT_17498 [Polychytrium aggregatum]|uniref:uncharacterized protein n=1 Tax=Polychytrium aggregatum TaxID=110093 RepID=UPI0022FEB5B3|nr:uncharacterized protein BJ171DRAFT_17498 [Polychytrium aggregatum]KAI9206690.1 hypothetical protein BJ171DRAFT_17498 [Polychytrium aggregatum]
MLYLLCAVHPLFCSLIVAVCRCSSLLVAFGPLSPALARLLRLPPSWALLYVSSHLCFFHFILLLHLVSATSSASQLLPSPLLVSFLSIPLFQLSVQSPSSPSNARNPHSLAVSILIS